MRRLFALFASIALGILVSLLSSCGSTSSSTAANNAPPATSSNPPSGSGSGSSGSGSGSASGGGSSGSAGSGSGSSSSFVAYAYTGGQNEIRGYGVNANGSLTPIAGSPYAVSNPQFATTPIATNGANLYAVSDAGTNLNVFSIDKSNGSLTLANKTSTLTGDSHNLDFASGLALDHTGASLYVVVGVSDLDGGFNLFTVGSSSGAQQSQYLQTGAFAEAPLIFSPNNQFGYSFLCTARTDGVFGYARASDGSLATMNLGPVSGPKVTGQAFCPGALAISERGYIAGVWKVNGIGSSVPGNETYVMSHAINSDGTLTPVSNSQVQTASISGHAVAAKFDPSGTFLAVAGDGGIQTYSLNGNGTLTPMGSPQAAGANFQSVAWDNANHVLAATSNQLYVFTSNNGVLAPVSGSPYAGDPALTVLPLQ